MNRRVFAFACASTIVCVATPFAAIRSASADVREDPITVRIVGPLQAAVANRAGSWTLEIAASRSGSLTTVRTEGVGWSAGVHGMTFPSRLEPGRAVRVTVEGATTDPSQLLKLQFDFDGTTCEHWIDLSPAAAQRALGPGAVTHVDLPMAGHAATLTWDHARMGPAPSGAVARPVAPPKTSPGNRATSGYDITVHGSFGYVRSDNVYVPADLATVRVYDQKSIGSDNLLGSGTTDTDGHYSVTVHWDPCFLCPSDPDIYVKFEASNSVTTVEDVNNNEYTWRTSTSSDYTGTDLDEGSLQPADNSQMPALHILTNLTRASRWLLSHQGDVVPPVLSFWPGPGTEFIPNNNAIVIESQNQWLEDAMDHEYGHCWMNHFGSLPTPSYCNNVCDVPVCGHCTWCGENGLVAWEEGWANWFADVVGRSLGPDYGLDPLNTIQEEVLQPCGQTLADPTITEGFLGALLRDIDDSNVGEHDPAFPGTWKDVLSLGTDPVFTVTRQDRPLSPVDFLNEFKARFPQYTEQLWETAKDDGYDLDTQGPGAPLNLVIGPGAGNCGYPSGDIGVRWTRPADDWSGVAGYSVLVAASPGLPPPTQMLGNVTSYAGCAPQGVYYVSVRAVDRDGHWSDSYGSLGPINVVANVGASFPAVTPVGEGVLLVGLGLIAFRAVRRRAMAG